ECAHAASSQQMPSESMRRTPPSPGAHDQGLGRQRSTSVRCTLGAIRSEVTGMRALQYAAFGEPPEIREVPTPEPEHGQVLVKMRAAGVCHSDEYFMSLRPEDFTTRLPLTLGHEGAGVVAGLSDKGNGIKEGDSVAVYGAWGCGVCRSCAAGAENYCV